MRILIACDKFRGSLTAAAANGAVGMALRQSRLAADVTMRPIADGGEGTLDALAGAADRHVTAVTGPFGDVVDAPWCLDRQTGRAVIEMAAVAGHGAVRKGAYDPDQASSIGVGELLRAAARAGAREVVVALGGSVTVDGGAGALEAIGARYVDSDGTPLSRPAGRALGRVARVDLSALDPEVTRLSILLAADVDNPLCGPDGAAAVFGPQKGVAEGAIPEFDAALANFDARLAEARGVPPVATSRFAGAAGGMMVGLSAAGSTVARDGFAIIAEAQDLSRRIAEADLVVTGEGSLDQQSLGGKGPVAIARMAREAGVPALAFAGRLAATADALREAGITAAFSIAQGPESLDDAMASAEAGLRDTARNAFDLLAAARSERR